MLTADVTIGGDTKQINIINLHAEQIPAVTHKVNMICVNLTSSLKDTLDTQYPSANLILLDYNDDVDFTVSSVPTTVSTYEAK
jgi:hypothetical protein